MDELELVVKLLASLSGDAKTMFIAWLIARYGSLVLIVGMFIGLIIYLFKSVNPEYFK